MTSHWGLRRVFRFAAVWVLAALSLASAAWAQQPAAPIALSQNGAPRSIAPEPLPPIAPTAPSAAGPAAPGALSPPAARIFCGQSVSVRLADPDAVPPRYRGFVGMFSDAAWTPQLCAALVVEHVAPDGTATIVYAFGPMGPGEGGPGGVLHGTGIIKDGELRFQNSDGSQFAFRQLYADLEGRLTAPQGQTYHSVFKKAM